MAIILFGFLFQLHMSNRYYPFTKLNKNPHTNSPSSLCYSNNSPNAGIKVFKYIRAKMFSFVEQQMIWEGKKQEDVGAFVEFWVQRYCKAAGCFIIAARHE